MDRARKEAFVAELGGHYPSPDVLGRIPLKQVLRAQTRAMRRAATPQKLMAFLPAVDGDVIPEQPLDAIRRGEAAQIPLLVGATLEEWKLFRLVDEGYFAQGLDNLDSAEFLAFLSAEEMPPEFQLAYEGFWTVSAGCLSEQEWGLLIEAGG